MRTIGLCFIDAPCRCGHCRGSSSFSFYTHSLSLPALCHAAISPLFLPAGRLRGEKPKSLMSILEKLTQQRPTDPLVDLARVCEHASVCLYEMAYIAGLPTSPGSTEMLRVCAEEVSRGKGGGRRRKTGAF